MGNGHDTFRFIKKRQIQIGRKVTYTRCCCDVRPQKEENQTRLIVGGDRLLYDGETSTEVASLKITKILINSTITTEGARFACVNIGNMYTNSRLDTPEYMRIHINNIPEEVQEEYNVAQYVKNDEYVYCEINGALYGLAQAGYIANKDLIKHLAPFSNYPSKKTPGLWLHKTRPVQFALVLNDFGAKYVNKDDINHLLEVVESKYPLKVD